MHSITVHPSTAHPITVNHITMHPITVHSIPIHPSTVHHRPMQVPAHCPSTALHMGGFRVTVSTVSPRREPAQPSRGSRSRAAPRPGSSTRLQGG